MWHCSSKTSNTCPIWVLRLHLRVPRWSLINVSLKCEHAFRPSSRQATRIKLQAVSLDCTEILIRSLAAASWNDFRKKLDDSVAQGEKMIHKIKWGWRMMKAVVMLTVANIGNMSHIHSESTFWCFFPPQEVCSRASAWATIRIGRDGVFTHRNFLIFFAQKLWHTEAFTQWSSSTRRFCVQKMFQTEDVAHRSFYTQELIDTEALNKSFYTEAFTHRSLQTQKFLCIATFTHRSF